MSVDLRLPSGLFLRDAPKMLGKKFEQWPWENYDGVPVSDPNKIGNADIDRVYQLGARTPRDAYKQLLKERGEKIAECLCALPTGVELEAGESTVIALRDPLVRLFDLCLGAKHVKLAGATKLLSPFRPALIPVIDSVIENYYWFATSIRNENQFRKLQRAYKGSAWGEYVFLILQLMRDDVWSAKDQIDKVILACKGECYASASRVRIVESLIWFYYARG